jgi:hypothetical protein
MGVEPGEKEAYREEDDGGVDGGLDQNVGRLRAEGITHDATAERGAETFLLAALHHDDEAHEGAVDHKDYKQNVDNEIGPKRVHREKWLKLIGGAASIARTATRRKHF